tara:strand:- start:822 stop:1181 length:360 start_codon:yes stop_codon:yes gene_type:complete
MRKKWKVRNRFVLEEPLKVAIARELGELKLQNLELKERIKLIESNLEEVNTERLTKQKIQDILGFSLLRHGGASMEPPQEEEEEDEEEVRPGQWHNRNKEEEVKGDLLSKIKKDMKKKK